MFEMASHSIHCPICKTPVDFDAPPIGPFCSARCKMADLGKWLSEEYVISEELKPQHFAEYEELEGGPELDRTDEYQDHDRA